ncbi:tail fiber domain-containing protein [Streptomyces sp. NPDC046939]|uniref:tail fiber domain-containing protein n=1 Tax=Streptomyces sp. NPDC046939 TaxID=3155376 RepID=UPI00340692BB
MEPGEAVNGYRVLEEVVRLPVSSWRYHWDPPEVRHLGPMAQDWWAAFGLGGSDTTICSTDANGVALVAIQALHRELADLRQEVAFLREQASDAGSDVRRTPPGTPV